MCDTVSGLSFFEYYLSVPNRNSFTMIAVSLTSIDDKKLALAKKLFTKTKVEYNNSKHKTHIRFYRESDGVIWLPRFWVLSNIQSFILDDGLKVPHPLEFCINGALMETPERPQVTVLTKTLDQLRMNTGATIVLPPGTGKTNIAIAIALELKQKTLIVCFQRVVMCQWETRIRSFVKGPTPVSVGLIQQDVCKTDDCMFVVSSIQSLVSRNYPPAQLAFGLVIIDEAHHIAALTFSACLQKVQYFYSLALTATPNRADGLEKMVYYLTGFPSYIHDVPKNDQVQINMITFDSGHQRTITMYDGTVNSSAMVTELTKDAARNQLLLKVINLLRFKYPTRKGLLLSDRVDHLKLLYEQLDHDHAAIITGSINTDLVKTVGKRFKQEPTFNKFITLSTYHMFSEAVDFDGDFLILSTPKSRVEQAVGRILRGRDLAHCPVVFDIVDPFSVFERQKSKRCKFYTQRGYQICQLVHDQIMRECDSLP